jgi:hypothetical protein
MAVGDGGIYVVRAFVNSMSRFDVAARRRPRSFRDVM